MTLSMDGWNPGRFDDAEWPAWGRKVLAATSRSIFKV